MPVAAFETAFVSGGFGIDAADELLQTVTEYLVRADSINSLVSVYPSSVAGQGTGSIQPKEFVRQVAGACKEEGEGSLFELLERLETLLQQEEKLVRGVRYAIIPATPGYR